MGSTIGRSSFTPAPVRPGTQRPVLQRSAATAQPSGFSAQSSFESADVAGARQRAMGMIRSGDTDFILEQKINDTSGKTSAADKAAAQQQLNGLKNNPERFETTIGKARLDALTDPAKAREMLQKGVVDPKTGAVLRAPPGPNDPLFKTLTRVANGEKLSDAELEKEMTGVAGRTWGDKRIMDKAMDDFTKMAEEAQQKALEAIKKGDPGAVK